jgi:hypothetical protein
LLIKPATKTKSSPPAMAPMDAPVAEPPWNWVSPAASADNPTAPLRTFTTCASSPYFWKIPASLATNSTPLRSFNPP